jgi:hypothetical protein
MESTQKINTFNHLKTCIMKNDYLIRNVWKATRIPFLVAFLILMLGFFQLGQSQVVTGSSVCEGSTLVVGLAPAKSNASFGLYRTTDGGSTYTKIEETYAPSFTYSFTPQTVVGLYEVYSFPGFPPLPADPSTGTYIGALSIWANPVPVVSGETNPCFNYSITYTTDAGMSNYGWSVSNGSIVSGGGSGDDFAEISWNGTPGAASVSVTYTDGNGCTSASATVYNVDVKYPVYIGLTGYSTLQAAINAASTNDIIDMVCDHAEGFVAVNKDVTIDGNGNTLTSTSSTYGLAIQSTGIIVQDITVDGAGTFGIHQQPNSGNLLIENSTVQNGGGTGFALNCSDNTTLKNITSTGNLGNGVSITNCSNVTIDGITTSGNAFAGGFSAGIGIFSNSSTCTPDGTDGVTLTGIINISEPVTVYEQATTGTITNITLPAAFTHYLGLNAPANSKFYYTSQQDALDAAEATLTASITYKPLLYVREMATGDLFVEAFTGVEMSIQAAVDAAENTIIYVGAGTYPEVLSIAKELDIRGPNYGINPNSATRNPEAIIQFPAANDSWYLVYIDGDGGGSTVSDVSLNGFEFNGVDSYGGTYPTELIFIAGAENVTIKDNIFKNFEMNALRYYYQYWDGTNWVSTWPIGADISDNYISNPDFYFDYSTYGAAPNTGIYIQGVYGTISGNVVEHVLSGCQIQPYGHPNTTSVKGTVSGNTFKGSRNGFWYNNSSSTTADWLFSGNTISGTPLPTGYTPGATWYGEPNDIWYGFAINGNSYGEVAFTGNTIAKGTTTLDAYGIRYVHGYAHAPKTAISGNTIDNLEYGIYLPVNLVNVGEITINNNSISGNSEYGIYNATSFAVDATSNWWGDATGPYNDPNNTCGLGNEISGNVTFLPWCADPTCTTTVTSLPVVNVTNIPNTYYCKIQDAIDDANSGDVIEVAAGAYEEIIVIDKSITLYGPNKDKSGYALDRVSEAIIQYPDGLADGNYYLATIDAGEVNIKGFTFNDNVSGSFTYDGTWPPPVLVGGVRSNESNTLVENNRFIGFNNIAVRMTQSDAFNQTVAKVNNTTRYNYFEGGAVYHAIYYQASAGVIEHNSLVNVSAGVQIQPYFTNAAGTVSNNEISMYSSGLYYNYANWTIDGNALWSFTGNTITAPATAPVWNMLTWNALARNFDGIRVETYLQDNASAPKIYEPKASFASNTINGVNASTAGGWLAVNGAYFRNVKGDVATNLTNITFSNNTYTNVEVGVQFDDQGTVVEYELSALYVNGNSYPTGMGIIEPYQIAFCGGGLVTNINQGTSFCSIQAAIDDANSGDVIEVAAGAYEEIIVIDKSITLYGPNKDKSGYALDRVSEAIIQYPDGLADGNYYLATIDAGEVNIKGFTFNDNVSGSFTYDGTWPPPVLVGGVRSNESNTLVENNRFIGFNNIAVRMTQSDAFNQTVAKVNNTTRYNYFEGGAVYHAIYYQASAGVIEHNSLVNVSAGVQIQPYFTNAAGTVSNNEISMYSSGLYYNYANWTIDGNALWSFTGNTITAPATAPVWNMLTWNALARNFDGIRVETYLQDNASAPKIYEPKASFASNTINGVNASTAGGWLAVNGAYFRNVKGDVATNLTNITFSNNTYTNVEVGVQFDDQGTVVEYELSALYVNGNSYPTGMGIIEPYQIAFCGGGLVTNINQGTSFCSIQAAIDDANSGEEITLSAGIFNESVTLNKSLKLVGAGCGLTIWQGNAVTDRSLLIVRNNSNPANIHVEISGIAFETENNQSIRGDWSAGYAEALTLDIHDNCFKHVNTRNPGNDFALYVDGANQTPRGALGAIRVYDNLLDVVTGGFLFEYCRAVDVIDNIFNVTYEAITFNYYGTTGTTGEQLVDGNLFNHVPVDWAFAINNWHGAGTYTVLPSYVTNNEFTASGFSYAILYGVQQTQTQPHEYYLNGNAILSGTITVWGDYASDVTMDATCNWWNTEDPFLVDAKVADGVQFLPFLVADAAGATYPWSGTDTYSCTGVGPVANQTQGKSYLTIQDAVDDANANDVILVSAGTYTESLFVYVDGLSLLGPNVGIDPNGLTPRVTESVIKPTEWYGIYITAANVTIDGFTLDGQGTCDYGIYAYISGTGNGSHAVTNSIVKNITTMGFVGWVQSGTASSQNYITNNLFEGIPGRAIVALWNYYANMTDNVIQNCGIGLYAENAHQPESTGVVEWKNNDISASRSGIWYNLAYGTATPLTIKDNIIDIEDDPAGIRWDGMWLTSLGGSLNPIISGNIITGGTVTQQTNGYHLWHITTTAANGITIEGGTVSNVDIGVFANNFEGYNSNGTGGAHVLVSGVNITPNATGVGVKALDSPQYTGGNPAPVVVTVIDDCSISGAETGILAVGDDASVTVTDNFATITGNEVGIRVKDGASLASVTGNTITNNTHGGIIIESTAGTIGGINNNTIAGNGTTVDPVKGLGLQNDKVTVVDATNNWWGHISGPYHSAYNTCGQGNAVVGLVNISPWLDAVGGSPVELPIENSAKGKFYCTIQDAINDADPGDVIDILVASHTEGPQIVVNKNITLKGLGKTSTTLYAAGNTGSSGDARGWILVQAGVTFNMEDLTMDGNGMNIMQGVRSLGTGTIDNVAFNNITYPGYNGIAVVGFGNITVQNSDFTNIGRIGIIFFGTGCTSGQAIDNTYTGKGAGDWIDYAVEVGGGAVANITGLNVSNNIGVASTDGSTSAGVIATTYFAAGTTATISGSTFTGNTTAIIVGFDASDASVVVANNNIILGNDWGVSSTGPIVDATSNWWGSNTGPSYAGNPCGTGDAVSDNVVYDPWSNSDLFEFDIYQLEEFTLTGTTSVCIGGNTDITLSGSQNGGTNFDYEYYLYNNGNLVAGSMKVGDGDPLTWTVTPSANSLYTVKAVNNLNLCELDMDGEAKVYVGPVTTVANITGACQGSNVEIPVTVTSFEEVGTFNLTLTFDPLVLSYQSFAGNALLPFMQVSNPGSGVLKISWFTGGAPVSLNDGDTTVMLTFTYLGGGASTLAWDDSSPEFCEYGSGAPDYVVFCDTPTGDYYINGNVSGYDSPEVSAVSMLSSDDDEATWAAVNGDLGYGYDLCIDPMIQYYHLDIDDLTSTATLDHLDFVQNAFYLNTTGLPTGFYDYWDDKGVDGVSNAQGWELAMWQIINGNEPMFYINYDLGLDDYRLIDGLQYQIGAGDQTLRVSGDYPQGTYVFTGTVTDEHGCESLPFNVQMTFNTIPYVTAVSLQSSEDEIIWDPVNGDLDNGYALCIDPAIPYYYFDIVALTSTEVLQSTAFAQNAFYLDGIYPPSFFDYWAAKGVVSGAGSWQGVMWDIINGNAPMFYVKFDGGDYSLIDGLQYQFASVEEPLRVSGDYPADTYTFTGSVTAFNGCPTAPFSMEMSLNTTPFLVFAFNGVQVAPGFTAEYCYNVPVEVTLDEIWSGVAPFDVYYSVTKDGSPFLIDNTTVSNPDDVLFSSLLDPGVYVINVTSLTDGNGCSASAATLALYNATVTINEEPEVDIMINDIVATYGYNVAYCFDETITAKLGDIVSGSGPVDIAWDVYVDGGLTPDPTLSGSATSVTTGFEFFSGLLPYGTYELQLTSLIDANGCEPSNIGAYAATIVVNQEPEVHIEINNIVATYGYSVEYCYSETITAKLGTIVSGTGPVDVAWEVFVDGSVTPDPILSGNASGVTTGFEFFSGTLAAGVYELQLTSLVDANGCEPSNVGAYTATITINEEPAVGFSFDGDLAGTGSTFYYSCYNDVVTVTLSHIWAGTAPFDIAWTVNGNPASATDVELNDVLFSSAPGAGSYVVQITSIVDANGCSPADYAPYTATAVIPVILNADVASTNVTWFGANDGTITITNPTGGYGTYEYSIDGGANWQSSGSFTGLAPGFYNVQIRDAANTGCMIVLNAALEITEPAAISISGYFNYYNPNVAPPNTPYTVMNNVTVNLVQSSTVILSTTTDGTGFYSFANVQPGTYEVQASTGKPVGGINVTDAAQVNAWSVSPYEIELVRFYAGDVVLTNRLDAGDAGRIQQYFMTGGTNGWVNRAVWTFWKKGETINYNPAPSGTMVYPAMVVPPASLPITQDFYGLVTGDFNLSFIPGSAKSASESLTLIHDKTILVNADTEFDLPVRAAIDMEVGAVSLILNYPSGQVEVLDAYLGTNPEEPLWFTLDGDELRIGWYAMQPVSLQDGDVLLTLKLMVNGETYNGEPIYFTLAADPLNELADGAYEVIGNAMLKVDVIESTATGVTGQQVSDELAFANHPNPFRETTTFTYDLPADGKVKIEVYSSVGERVMSLVDEVQRAGHYTLTINDNTLKPGVYAARLILQTEEKVLTRSITLIRHQ